MANAVQKGGMRSDEVLLKELVAILADHAGEAGPSEGAVDTLRRIVEDHRCWVRGVQQANKHGLDIRPEPRCTEADRIDAALQNVAERTEAQIVAGITRHGQDAVRGK